MIEQNFQQADNHACSRHLLNIITKNRERSEEHIFTYCWYVTRASSLGNIKFTNSTSHWSGSYSYKPEVSLRHTQEVRQIMIRIIKKRITWEISSKAVGFVKRWCENFTSIQGRWNRGCTSMEKTIWYPSKTTWSNALSSYRDLFLLKKTFNDFIINTWYCGESHLIESIWIIAIPITQFVNA